MFFRTKSLFLLLFILLLGNVVFSQAFASTAEIITVYSQNERYYLRSIPYDSEFPSLRGRTLVFEKGSTVPIYVFERGFDSVDDESNNLILSNDGEVILFAIPWSADEEQDGLKSISIYKRGKLIKSYTRTEITGCDLKKERCDLVYNNDKAVVDGAASNSGSANYRKIFKKGTDDKEKFLSNFAILSVDDVVYITDSKRNAHQFNLKESGFFRSDPFDSIYGQIKDKGRFSKVEFETFDAPTYLDFPKLMNGKDTYESLAFFLGMKQADISEKADYQYRLYQSHISGLLSRDGSFEIETIDVPNELSKDKIVQFFKTNKFSVLSLPKKLEKWHIDDYFYLRNKDAGFARQEKRQEEIKEREELKKRLAADTIDGKYIPKDLGECFIELDKLLTEVDKKEMQSLSKRDDMIQYHMGLGMWLRNNWGLWGGSRLQTYFRTKGITHPDNMSGVILNFYYDWLHGEKQSWLAWEKNPK